MSTQNLLVELFVEELPPKALNKLGESFADSIWRSLDAQYLIEPAATIPQDLNQPDSKPFTAFASPRRLAVHINRVRYESVAMERQVKLMPKKVGYLENGQRSEALSKRLAKEGYFIDDHSMQLIEVDEKGVPTLA